MLKSKSDSKFTLLVCDCEGTMPLDARALAKACGRDIVIHSQLCRSGIDAFTAAATGGGRLVVCCTQEAPLFDETLDDKALETPVAYVNIREHAGWSEDARRATPKIAALIAAAAVDAPPARMMSLASTGRVLVYGHDDTAMAAAAQLADRLDVTLVLAPPADALPPRVTSFPTFRGRVATAAGHLGAFEVIVEGLAPARPSSREGLAFDGRGRKTALAFDLIVDLAGGAPLISAGELRDGYLKPDPGSPAAVQKALFDAAELVGEFEKPIYVRYDEALCAHSRSRLTGCSRCIDLCPASAITPAGDHVFIDANLCAGCGTCASVCPTGAASYAVPPAEALVERLRTLLRAYRGAGGKTPVLLVHDPRHGEDMIALASRAGRGLPAHVLPFTVNEIGQIGFDFLAAATAYGATRIVLLAPPEARDRLSGLAEQVGYAEAALAGLGYGEGRVVIVEDDDPEALSDRLYGLDARAEIPSADFLPIGGRRSLINMALRHLHDRAPKPGDVVALPRGAPFGAVRVNAVGCTLCLSCVTTCPTAALTDDPEIPMLRFTEQICVQCGLCRSSCPESVVTLEPRFNFADEARRPVVLKKEEPFTCASCGTPFGTRASVERTIERLAEHPMFAGDPAALERLRLCENCRVVAHFKGGQPMAHGTQRRIRTTEDYIAGTVSDDDE